MVEERRIPEEKVLERQTIPPKEDKDGVQVVGRQYLGTEEQKRELHERAAGKGVNLLHSELDYSTDHLQELSTGDTLKQAALYIQERILAGKDVINKEEEFLDLDIFNLLREAIHAGYYEIEREFFSPRIADSLKEICELWEQLVIMRQKVYSGSQEDPQFVDLAHGKVEQIRTLAQLIKHRHLNAARADEFRTRYDKMGDAYKADQGSNPFDKL